VTSLLDRQRERFLANPDSEQSFQSLEEDLFLAGDWEAVIQIYQRRLEAESLAEQPRRRAEIQFRMGQVYHDHLGDPDRAITCYREALRSDSQYRPAMTRLRKHHSAQDQWDVALQIAEMETSLLSNVVERADLFAEMGSIWLERLGDSEQALEHFQRALSDHPEQIDALEGSAQVLEATGQAAQAAQAWDRAIELLRGAARANALVARARLSRNRLGEPELAGEFFRRALTDDPDHPAALEAVAKQASSEGKWALFADLQERRFELASESAEQAEIAVALGQVQREQLSSPAAAQLWFERAVELDPANASCFDALADLARDRGDDDALLDNLECVSELSEGEPPVSVLLELASLHSDRGNFERAHRDLRRAFQLDPADALVAEALCEVLTRLDRNEELVEVLEQRAGSPELEASAQALVLSELAAVWEERLDDTDFACQTYRRAFESDPMTPSAASALERLYRKTEDWDSLRSFFEYAGREGSPDQRSLVLCSLAALLADHFDAPDEATQALEEALALEPDSVTALRGLQTLASASGDESALLRAYEREADITLDKNRLAQLVAELAPRLEGQGQLDSALAWVVRWVAAVPSDPEALFTSAHLREKLGQDAELVADLESLDPLLPSDLHAQHRRRLGAVHAQHNRSTEAIAAYRAAIEADADDILSHQALVEQLDLAGQLEELAQARWRLTELLQPPELAGCLDELARLLADRLGDLNGAIDALEQLVDQANAPDDVCDRLDALLTRTARFDQLADHLAKRIAGLGAEDPEAQPLKFRRAEVLLESLDRFDEAAGAYREILERDPDCGDARRGIEKALRAAGDPSGLADFLGEQIEASSNPQERIRLAFECALLLDESLDRSDEAIELLRRLIGWSDSLDSDDSEDSDSAGDGASFRERASDRLEALLERTEDWEGLRKHLHASIGDDTSEPDLAIHERLGALYRDRLGNAPRAIDQLEAATMIAPERADLWRTLAELYEEAGRLDDLVTALEAESATGPAVEHELTLHSRAAQLCAGSLNDPDRAQEHYERVLELDPNHSAAADFLIEYWKRNDNPQAVISLLGDRLAALDHPDENDRDWPTLRASLRLQIAELKASELDDLDGAIEQLAPALDEVGPQIFIAEPLADLYERAARTDKLIELCRMAAPFCSDPDERAGWATRLGATLRGEGREQEATEAYRSVLTDRPDDSDAQAALRDLYRGLGEAEPLARLLELELSHLAGEEEIPLRLELAELLTSLPERRHEALAHLQRILQIDPEHDTALEQGLDLAETLQQESENDAGDGSHRLFDSLFDALLELFATALSRPQSPADRAGQLARRGRLFLNSSSRVDKAIADFREALSLDLSRGDVLELLRATLESHEQWEGALDCIFRQACGADSRRRAELFEEAVNIASEKLDPEATLPWLERLRGERPQDPQICARIAEIHRSAGRPEATLRALEAQAALIEDGEDDDGSVLRDLHLERARILETELDLDGCAAAAFEDARRAAPSDQELLHDLANLYDKLGRSRQRAEVLEALVAITTPDEPDKSGDPDERETPATQIQLLRDLAAHYRTALADPKRAAAHLQTAVANIAETAAGSSQHGELLRELGVALRESRERNAWACCAEEELRILDPEAQVFEDRRLELHRMLARAYEQELGLPDAALRHLRALADSERGGLEPEASTDAKDSSLLHLLRVQGDWVELETRLTTHLERRPEDPQGWLELGQLRDERLHSTAAAAGAYRQVLQREPDCLPALRALRSGAERLGRWSEVAQTLEHELEHMPPQELAACAALLRRRGDICWRRLQSTTRASRCYAGALEADPNDFESLHSLQRLLENMEDWRGALDLYESEVEMLGESESEQRFEASLRAGVLAREHTEESDRALRNYEYAAEIAPLPAKALLELAELYEQTDRRDAFAKTFERWCDDPESGASCDDHVRLADTWEELGEAVSAQERIERALEVNAEHREAWDTQARLQEHAGDVSGAAHSLGIAADLSDDTEACKRLIRAAELCGKADPERAAESLRSALRRDSIAADGHARLAQLAFALGEFHEAELAGQRVLELAPTSDRLDVDEHLAAALNGGRAARQLNHPETAARCFAAALKISPEHSEALSNYGEALAQLGQLAEAKKVLDCRLAQTGPNPDRATQLAVIGSAHWEAGEIEDAASRLEAALREDAELDEAHETLALLWESQRKTDKGIACLERWANVAQDHTQRAQRLLRAAEWELRVGMRDESAEQHLREVLDVDPSELLAWEALAELLWRTERSDDALEIASLAMSAATGASSSRVLSLIRGRALQQLGEQAEAAEAFEAAIAADSSCVEAALSRARLLRGLGEWQAAAETLQGFVDNHRGDDSTGLSEVLQQLGRLLAGPLEDADGAIAAYRQAVELDPDRTPWQNFSVTVPTIGRRLSPITNGC